MDHKHPATPSVSHDRSARDGKLRPVESGVGRNADGTLRTPMLDRIRSPLDLRNLSAEQLGQVADELRAETLDTVSTTGGHLGASLGVVELTVALHAVFDTPRDRLIWDVGHQTYPHKILTERRDRIRTLRQPGRPVRLHAPLGKRVRPVRRGTFIHLDLGRPRHGHRARPAGRRGSFAQGPATSSR